MFRSEKKPVQIGDSERGLEPRAEKSKFLVIFSTSAVLPRCFTRK